MFHVLPAPSLLQLSKELLVGGVYNKETNRKALKALTHAIYLNYESTVFETREKAKSITEP